MIDIAQSTWTCTQKQITLLPTSQRGFNISGLVVYKGLNTRVENSSGDCNGKEIKAVKMNGVNYGGNMDRGSTTFTSDVSLPKYDKQLCWVNKFQLGN